MIDQGCAVALATDFNPGSCFSNSIPLLFALATLYMGMTTEEAVSALTINGAAALKRADTIGSIDVGKQGDLVILEYPSYRFLPYHVGVNIVEKVVKQGNIVFSKAWGGTNDEKDS
jgi:imidazolonepropionase